MSELHRRAVCWIRRDLRLFDHAALAEATSRAEEVAVVFVFDRNILDALEDRDDRRVNFIHGSLVELDAKLREHGSRLIVRHGDPVEEIPEVARAFGATLVVTAGDIEPYAKQRDKAVEAALAPIAFKKVKDSAIFECREVLQDNGNPYRVFTPYSKAWLKKFDLQRDAREHTPHLDRLAPTAELDAWGHPWTMADLGFAENAPWVTPGEDAAQERLANFVAKLDLYKDARDFPAQQGTSVLSVDLRFGTLSIRHLVRLACSRASDGAEKWLSELIWREFYRSILAQFPHVATETFQDHYNGLRWPGDPAHFEAWKQGQTGYPIVDAAMRCLNATGWMHNRLRMIVASFLTKDLLIKYTCGEAYFARMLLDFDLASNNGGWQWSASTGTDAQPYFRIFHPVKQSEKFDPEGTFIREWVPELRNLNGAALHAPWSVSEFERRTAGVILGETYPHPIVDHSVQRELAIALLSTKKA